MDSQYYSIIYYLIFLFIYYFNRSGLVEKELLFRLYKLGIYFTPYFILYMINNDFRIQYIYALISWFFFGHVILSSNGYDLEWIDITYCLIIFYSELYELPIYFDRLLTNSIFPIAWNMMIIKLFFIIIIVKRFDDVGLDSGKYVMHIIKSLSPYLALGWLIVRMFTGINGMISPIILKFICLVDLLYFLKNNEYH